MITSRPAPAGRHLLKLSSVKFHKFLIIMAVLLTATSLILMFLSLLAGDIEMAFKYAHDSSVYIFITYILTEIK